MSSAIVLTIFKTQIFAVLDSSPNGSARGREMKYLRHLEPLRVLLSVRPSVRSVHDQVSRTGLDQSVIAG